MSKTCLGAVLAVAVFLSACSQPNKTADTEKEAEAKAPEKPPEPVPAKTAYWEAYTKARPWATDLVALKVDSKEEPGFKNDGGKAAIWEITFGSPSLHQYRVYTYAIAAHPPDVYKGVAIGEAMPWSGPTRDVMPFPNSEFATDSDAAYKAAMETPAGPWVKGHPDKPLVMELHSAYVFQAPVWYLQWGDKKLGYAVYVNAATGKALRAKG